MTIRSPYPAALVVALAAALFALPACNKKSDGTDGGEPSPEEKVRLAAARMKSQNNLKQIGIALHNHMDANNALPQGIYSPDGKTPLLSWRVQILPYVEEVTLYKQFRLNEPWDSQHNKALISRVPRVYVSPLGGGEPGTTPYRAFSGKGTWLPGPPTRINVGQIQDGFSNSIAVAEADPVVWTKPDELPFDPSRPPPKIGGLFPNGANVLFLDGSVRFLKSDTPPATMKALITIAGSEVVDLP